MQRFLERRKSYDAISKADSFANLVQSQVQAPLTPKPKLRRNETADIAQVLAMSNKTNSHTDLPSIYQELQPLKKKRSSYSILPTISEGNNSSPNATSILFDGRKLASSHGIKKRKLYNPKVKDDTCIELRHVKHRERRVSLNRIDDLKATERKIDFFQKILLKRFALIRGQMRKKLKNLYEAQIVKRSNQREYLIRKQKFVHEMQKAKDKRGFGPWELLWEFKQELIKRDSPYSDFPSYRIRQIVVKGGDDLRQEMVAMQVIRKVKEIFARESARAVVYAYDIIAIDSNSGALGMLLYDPRVY